MEISAIGKIVESIKGKIGEIKIGYNKTDKSVTINYTDNSINYNYSNRIPLPPDFVFRLSDEDLGKFIKNQTLLNLTVALKDQPDEMKKYVDGDALPATMSNATAVTAHFLFGQDLQQFVKFSEQPPVMPSDDFISQLQKAMPIENIFEKDRILLINQIWGSFPKWLKTVVFLALIICCAIVTLQQFLPLDKTPKAGDNIGRDKVTVSNGDYVAGDKNADKAAPADYSCFLHAEIASNIKELKRMLKDRVQGDLFGKPYALRTENYDKFSAFGGSFDKTEQQRIGWFYQNIITLKNNNALLTADDISKEIGLGNNILEKIQKNGCIPISTGEFFVSGDSDTTIPVSSFVTGSTINVVY